MMKMTGTAALLALASTAQVGYAFNGAQLTAHGPTSAGMGGVSLALPQDTTAAADNPAGMSLVGDRLDLFGALVRADSTSTFGSPQNRHESDVVVPVPGIGFNKRIDSKWTAGVSVTGAGLASDYKEPALPLPGAGHAKASLVVANISPTLTYKPTDTLAVGASLILGVQQFRADGVIAAGPGGGPVAIPSHGNSWAYGLGAAVGVLWQPTEMVSVGGSYVSETHFSKLSGYKGDLLAEGGGRLNSPARYGVGLALRPNKDLTVALDYLRVMWGQADGYNSPSSFNWHNQNVVRVGAAYQINDQWTVRAGYSRASSHLDSDHTLANFYANGIGGKAVTVGFTYNVSKTSSVIAAFEYQIPRTLNGTGLSSGTNIRTGAQVLTVGYAYKF